jgi:hypothetical protein
VKSFALGVDFVPVLRINQ